MRKNAAELFLSLLETTIITTTTTIIENPTVSNIVVSPEENPPGKLPDQIPSNWNIYFFFSSKRTRQHTVVQHTELRLQCRTEKARIFVQYPAPNCVVFYIHIHIYSISSVYSGWRSLWGVRVVFTTALRRRSLTLDLSSLRFFAAKRTGSVLTLNIEKMISFPFSARVRIRVKMCAPAGDPCSCSGSSSALFCLNETAQWFVMWRRRRKANNPSLNNRAGLKEKKFLLPAARAPLGQGLGYN